VDWTASLAGAVSVHISTDGGANYCEVPNGVPITDFLHADDQQQLCIFPTVSVHFIVKWKRNAVLQSFTVKFLGQHPNQRPRPDVQVRVDLV
jgi:hypothetical protein